MDLRLRQKDVAEELGVNKDTIRNWEMERAAPALWQWPGIVRFLGYVPFDTTGDALPLCERLKGYRSVRGLSQKRLAALLGVDASAVWHWERGRSRPNEQHAARIEGLLKRTRPSP